MHCVAVQKHLVVVQYSETSLIRHSMGPENNVGLGGCWIRRLLDYGVSLTILTYGDCTSYNGRIRENVGLERFRCTKNLHTLQHPLCHCTGVCVDT